MCNRLREMAMKVIIDGYAWVKKEDLEPRQIGNLKRALTIQPKSTSEFDDGLPPSIPLYAESEDALGLPRGFYAENKKNDVVLDIRVSDGAPMGDACLSEGFTGMTTGTPRYDEQSNVATMFTEKLESQQFGGLILQAGCAFGKTITSLRIALALGRRTLILVHKEFFLKQWMDRIKEFFPGARVGVCRQKKCEFKGYDFTIALVQSLASRKYDPLFYKAYGLVITDEVHRIGAQSWSPLIPQFNARYRMGLSATPRRRDGAERVFFEHIGEIAYKAKNKGTDFSVSRVNVPFELKPISRGSYFVPAAKLNSGQIESQIAKDEVSNATIVSSIKMAVDNGRKCFVVSTRTEQLWILQEKLERWFESAPHKRTSVGWVTGSVFVTDDKGRRVQVEKKVGGRKKLVFKTRKPSQAEYDTADTCQIMLATKQMIEEGYDNQAIDVVYLAMPLSDPEQTVGRGRRPCEPSVSKCARLCPWRAGICTGKPKLVVKDVVHTGVRRLERKWDRRASFYRKEGVKIP